MVTSEDNVGRWNLYGKPEVKARYVLDIARRFFSCNDLLKLYRFEIRPRFASEWGLTGVFRFAVLLNEELTHRGGRLVVARKGYEDGFLKDPNDLTKDTRLNFQAKKQNYHL